jgi:hypothetical protein
VLVRSSMTDKLSFNSTAAVAPARVPASCSISNTRGTGSALAYALCLRQL